MCIGMHMYVYIFILLKEPKSENIKGTKYTIYTYISNIEYFIQ